MAMEQAARTIRDVSHVVGILLEDGWRVIAPAPHNGAMVPQALTSPADLPRGLTDEQGPGRYRLEPGAPERWFDQVVGPQGWKSWLHPPRARLWTAERTADGFAIREEPDDWPRTAFFGVRPCEIAAMRVLDRAIGAGEAADPVYTRRRRETLIVAVQCARSAATCFCRSAGTGPRAADGFDLALTELDGRFLLEIGSERGAAIAARVPGSPATAEDRAAALAASERAAAAQTRRLSAAAPDALRDRPEHPRWDDVAARCLGCANCTLVCPTCFCADVEDVSDLSGDRAERWRTWDSCFGRDFTRIGGGPTRGSTRSRYRQWLTHKLSTWRDQFGCSGCVGCGRCIAWCPVGIDLTEEAAAIAAPETAS